MKVQGTGWQLRTDDKPQPGDVLFRHKDGTLTRSPHPTGNFYGIIGEDGKPKRMLKPFDDMPYYIWGARLAETCMCVECGMAFNTKDELEQRHKCPGNVKVT